MTPPDEAAAPFPQGSAAAVPSGEERERAPLMPETEAPPFDYNPSAWSQRIPVAVHAGLSIAMGITAALRFRRTFPSSFWLVLAGALLVGDLALMHKCRKAIENKLAVGSASSVEEIAEAIQSS